jgi:alkylation response protein AidB-like acyl-CoA dehydrogenase
VNLTNKQETIQEAATQIAREELAPRAAAVDRDLAFPAEGLGKLGTEGLLGLTVPEGLGGGGADALSFVLATEAIAQACASTALLFLTHGVVSRAVAAAGSDAQKDRYLPGMVRGEQLGAIAVSEPDAGASAGALSLRAKTDGDDLVIDGVKSFVTAAGAADVYVVVLRTEEAKGPLDLSALLVEKGTPGFSVGEPYEGMGMRGTSWGELAFEGCRVPRTNLLGPENGYPQVAMSYASLAMVGTAGIALGIAQAAVDAAVAHAKNRVIAGQAIGEYQGVQFLLAEMGTELAAARALTLSATQQLDAPPPSPVPLYMAKLHATEMAIDVARKALQVHGGHGYRRALPLERYYRDARALTLHFTPSELLKSMLGRMLMGMPPM